MVVYIPNAASCNDMGSNGIIRQNAMGWVLVAWQVQRPPALLPTSRNGQEGGLRIVPGRRTETNIRGCNYTIKR